MKTKKKNNLGKECYSFKFSFIDWIGIVLGAIFIMFVFFGCLITGYYIVSGVVALWLFLLFHKRRWVRYFYKNYIEVFHIRKYRHKVNYVDVTKIAYEEALFFASQFQVFYREADKKNIRVQFEYKNSMYLAKVLNYIKDKLPENVIDNESLILINIVFDNGEYKYKAGTARKYRKSR